MRWLSVMRHSYYGWRIALTLAVTETISWGILYYAFAIFIRPMELDTGWSRTELTGAFSLALLLRGAMAVPVGIWIDRHGARLLMSAASLLASALLVLWSQAGDLAMFYLVWAGLGICMAALFYEPAFAAIANWFLRERSRALALITVIAGFASTIFLPLANSLLQQHGWRHAVLLLAILLAVTTIPLHALVLRRRPADIGLQADGASEDPGSAEETANQSAGEILRGNVFWSLTAAFSLAMLAGTAIRVHFVPYLLELGVNDSLAAAGAGLIGAAQVLGRLAFAPFAGRLSLLRLTALSLALQLLALLLLLLPGADWRIWLFVLLFGAAVGSATLLRPALLAERFGPARFGRTSSVMVVFLTLAGTVAPVAASAIRESAGSYGPVLWGIAGFTLAAMLALLPARGPATMVAGK
ncbi:MAG: MFS transporter [Anaerolineae bacterium]|nr:MFS transporter [Anaerolineae bacterium]